MAVVSEVSLWQLFKHLSQWLGNLSRAKQQRQRESIEALRAVVVAARHTQAYLRQLDDTGQQDHAKLAALWTELGFRLSDLGLAKLAKRCDIRGRYWANPDTLDKDFLKRADIGLERMEKMALQLLAEIEPAHNHSRKPGPKKR